jgi:hypothetical protein
MSDKQGPGVWTIAFGVLLGLIMFTTISAVIGTTVISYNMRKASEAMTEAVDEAKKSVPQGLLKPTGHWATVEHPVRGRDECLAESAGVADEKYARCRNGWSERVWVTE